MTVDDRVLQDFILGRLADDVRDGVEQELFRDDAVLARLLAVEDALVEGVLDGTSGATVPAALAGHLRMVRALRAAAAVRPAIVAGLVVAVLRLRPGLVRGGPEPATLHTTPDLERVELVLELPAATATLHVVLETEDGNERVRVGPASPSADGTLHVSFPAAALRPGLMVARVQVDGESVEEFFFRVR